VASEGVCSQCGKGWCPECLKRQGTAAICPMCDVLCLSAAERERQEEMDAKRRRPLRDELGAVMRYPLTDTMAFVMLAVVVWLFQAAAQMAAFGGFFGVLFSQGLLYAYSFTAINRVSSGHMEGFMPEIGDLGDLVGPVRLGVASMIVSSGPLLLLLFLIPAVMFFPALFGPSGGASDGPEVAATPPPELQALLDEDAATVDALDPQDELEDEGGYPGGDYDDETPGPPLWAFAALPLALLWKLVYSPVALIAAAISRSFLATLNPLVGVDAIRRMGSVYWEAMGAYTAIAIGQSVVGMVLAFVPFVGGVLTAFVQSYAFLAIGCLLGLAVFKKARELGVD